MTRASMGQVELGRRLGRDPDPAEEAAWGTRFLDEVPEEERHRAEELRRARKAGTWPPEQRE